MDAKPPNNDFRSEPRPDDAGGGSSPDARVTPADRRIQGLARVFAGEPELISACLQGLEDKPPLWAGQILAAARLAIAEHPDYADLHYHAGRAALAAGELGAAAGLLEGALRANPDYGDALILAGQVALLRRRPREARTLLECALAKGANYPDVHMLLGSLWQQEQDWVRARESYERALALNANLAAARMALGSLPTAGTSGKNHELPA